MATSPGLPRLHYRLDRSVTSQQERGNWRKPPGRAIQAIALSCCQPSRQAAVPYVRVALRAVLTPQIETTKATGLVFLPWAMTGLILADTAPLQAVLVQAVVMFLVLGRHRHHHRGDRPGPDPAAVHPRPPAGLPAHLHRPLKPPLRRAEHPVLNPARLLHE